MQGATGRLAVLVVSSLTLPGILAGCAGDRPPTSRDIGSVYYDQGAPPAFPDSSVPPTPPGASTCAQILQCAQGCGADSACSQACVTAGSLDDKARMAALDACLQAAFAGTCSSQCSGNLQSAACQDCAGVACKAELDGCLKGGGGTAGFGAACDVASPSCADGLACLGIAGATAGKGLCTKTCPALGGACEGAEAGTEAACLLSAQGSNFCAFVCTLPGDKTFPCPATTTCAAADNPPGSGQRVCMP